MKELWKSSPKGCAENMIQGEKYRFTLLTSRLIRMEYREDGKFEDRATQTIQNRAFAPVSYYTIEKEDGFELVTDRMRVTYDRKQFSSNGLMATGQGGLWAHGMIWHYGDHGKHNLKGTTRTLDEVNGSCELEEGIMSVSGFAVLDDSNSLVLTEDGWIEPRCGKGEDLYLFMYGTDYQEALADYYELTGRTPMLPRFAMGNWWSRYFEYSEKSYKELITRFEQEEIPFSVAVIDMDWHITEVEEKYGAGWTGYTWNKELFPDPEGFLSWLHEHGLQTTLNLHPADGVRAYEKAYPDLARAMGVDPASEEPIPFDIADRKFLEEYFKCVLHPMEDEGVDFWWIDWQQGNNTKIPGLDPLWMLNHYHYLDSARDGKRPLTFSRYAGPGSHRYPVGFSGDTIITWESLDFQPYFTSTASNIGYGWWSHDIGGHMRGYKDNELALRWMQLGVFSPINRLHSTKNVFNGKEPWRYPMEIHQAMNEILRLRHQMIPYLYTMNHRAWSENRPIVEPMYYDYPMQKQAYEKKNQYFFGSELMVAPITSPQIKALNRGKVSAWLPEGLWLDFFTGMIYQGGRELNLYRDVHTLPVFAKAGAIVPMTEEIHGKDALNNPQTLEIRVYAGADGSFTLYEDENDTLGYLENISVTTKMDLNWTDGVFTIRAAQGNLALIPKVRTWKIRFYGIDAEGYVETIVENVPVDQTVEVKLPAKELSGNSVKEMAFEFLNQAELSFNLKEELYQIISSDLTSGEKIAAMISKNLDADLLGCLTEILTAYDIRK